MVVLRGVGHIAWSWANDIWLSLEELQRYKSLGFNCLALQYFYDVFEKQDGTYDMESFRWIDEIVHKCELTDMKVYLCHRTTWGADPTAEVYDGSWLKYWDKARNGIADVFDPNGSLLPRICRFLEFLVQRYDASPAVVGYNPENYPFHNYEPPATELQQYHQHGIPAMTNAIRKHSSKTIFMSPHHKGTWVDYATNRQDTREFDLLPPPVDSNTTYLCDGYGLVDVVNWTLAPVPDYTKDKLKTVFAGAVRYKNLYGVKLMVDEFGIPHPYAEEDFTLQYTNDLMDVFNEFTDSWVYHMGLINADHTIKCPRMLDLLSTRAKITPTPPLFPRVREVLYSFPRIAQVYDRIDELRVKRQEEGLILRRG